MTRSSDKKASECHVLDFFHDTDNGCALTVYTRGVRFHIIADAQRLKGKTSAGKAIEKEYNELISKVRKETEQDEDTPCNDFEKEKDPNAGGTYNSADEVDDANHSQDSGHGTSEADVDSCRGTDDNGDDVDSAVDVGEEQHSVKEVGLRDSGVVLSERYAAEAEKSLHNWMLSPFGQTFQDLAPASELCKTRTLHEWYHGPAHFFNLEIDGDQLSSSQEEPSGDLEQRIIALIPKMPIPKYIKDLDIPFVQAKDITVVAEGTEPEPYHPIKVKVKDQVQFLKMVDMSQYAPTKREIKLLKEIERKGLHKKIRVPQVLGLVYENSKSEIMGFLQTDIEDPTPLTNMLDSDVIEDNRKKWAQDTERFVKVLHDHDIIWGDAKADNFMVDKHGDLWIIDFGGSYTDGWIDPELVETQEGDDMGTEKIINALEDPDSNTFDPEGHVEEEDVPKNTERTSKKRSRESSDESELGPSKRQK